MPPLCGGSSAQTCVLKSRPGWMAHGTVPLPPRRGPCLAVKVHSFTHPFIPLIYSHTRPPSNHPSADLFIIYIFMYPSTHLFIHLYSHSFISYTVIHSFVIHSFTTSYICPLIDSFAHPSIHHSFIHSCLHSFTHLSLHLLIHLTTITYWMSDVPGAVWSTGNLAMNKSDKNPCHHGADICVCVSVCV